VTKLLQCLRDELVRRDYAAPTIRSYTQIVEPFHQHTGARLDRLTPAQLQRYLYSAKILRGHDLAGQAGRCGEFPNRCGSGVKARYYRPFGDASHRPRSAR
jgi:hypothetical protein